MSVRQETVFVVNESDNPLPKYQTEGSSGMDLMAEDGVVIAPSKMQMVPTGLRVKIPQGCEIQIRSRSGMAFKSQIFVLNSPGTIDADFRGLIGVLLFNAGAEPFEVKKGDRIAQAVLCPVIKLTWEEVESLEKTERGDGGFGHTGI